MPTYREVVYHDLWPGVDLVFRGNHGRLKYELHVAPGASVNRIRLAYSGVTPEQIEDGVVRLAEAYGSLAAVA